MLWKGSASYLNPPPPFRFARTSQTSTVFTRRIADEGVVQSAAEALWPIDPDSVHRKSGLHARPTAKVTLA
jgi:hypothetical protein